MIDPQSDLIGLVVSVVVSGLDPVLTSAAHDEDREAHHPARATGCDPEDGAEGQPVVA